DQLEGNAGQSPLQHTENTACSGNTLSINSRRNTGMARIMGGIAASHTPTIGFAYDRNKRDDPVWAPIFENFAPLSSWLAEKRPDVLVMIYNDHVTSFFFDHYSAFA